MWINKKHLKNILDEFRSVREATITFFSGLDNKVLIRKGIAEGKIMSVRAAAYHIAGHELHHMMIIKKDTYDVLL